MLALGSNRRDRLTGHGLPKPKLSYTRAVIPRADNSYSQTKVISDDFS